MHRGNSNRITQAEVIEFIKLRGRFTDRIALIDAEHNRTAASEEHRGNLLVRCHHAGAQVCDKDNHIRRVNGKLGLRAHLRQNHVVCLWLNSSRIHKRKRPAAPFALTVNPISRHTGVSSTMETREPTSLLNRVDFPTFGRPTIATTGFAIAHHSLSINFSSSPPSSGTTDTGTPSSRSKSFRDTLSRNRSPSCRSMVSGTRSLPPSSFP